MAKGFLSRRCFLGWGGFLVLLILSGSVSAQVAPDESSILRLFYQEQELVTTARRTVEDARTAPAIVESVSAEEIENMGARKLSDVLRTLESVYVSFQKNSLEYVWIRGVRNRYNDKVLLLVDGIPRRDLVYEHARIDEYLPLINVERIEVVRGPGSALYGTNAFAGVINIITKRPGTEPELEVRIGGGNADTRQASVQGGFRWGETGIYAYVDGYDTEGDGMDFDSHQLENELAWNPKKRLAGGLTVTHGDFTLRFERIHAHNTYFADWDVPTWRWEDEGWWFNDTYLSAEFDRRIDERWSVEAVAYYQDYDHKSFWRDWIYGRQSPTAGPGDVAYRIDVEKRGRRSGAEFQVNYRPHEDHELVGGLSYERETIAEMDDIWHDVRNGGSTRPFYFDPVSLTTCAAYLQETWRAASWATVTLGLRSDHHELFGWKVTPRIGAAFHPGDRLVVKVLYGEAFRAPSFREFFTVDETDAFPGGSTDLKPERIRTLEGAVNYTFSQYAGAHLVLYRELTYDSIYAREYDDPALPYQYDNHEGDQITGYEAGVDLAWPSRVTAYVNVAHTHTDLFNVPRNMAHAGLNVPWKDRLNWNLHAIWVADRRRDPDDNYYYDPAVPPHKRPDPKDVLIVNSTLRLLNVAEGLELRLSVDNLFDRDNYDPAFEPTKYYDFQQPGRTFLIQAMYRF